MPRLHDVEPVIEALSGAEKLVGTRPAGEGHETVLIPIGLLPGAPGGGGAGGYFAHAAGAAFAIDLAQGALQKLPTTGNATITLPLPDEGQDYALLVAFGGEHELTFLGGGLRKWPGGEQPDPGAAEGTFALFGFHSDGARTFGRLIETYPADPTADAIALLGFAAGEYFADGDARVLADMFQVVDNGYWDPSYQPDPADIGAGGWAAQGDQSAYLVPSELAKTGWWDGGAREFVAVIEYDFEIAGETTDDSFRPSLILQAAEGFTFNYLDTDYLAYCGFEAGHWGDGSFYAETYFYTYDYSDNSVTDERSGTDIAPASPVKIAGRFTADEIAFCANGGAIFTAAITRGDLFPAFDLPYLANAVAGDASGNIRRVTIYPPDADIQALSAV